jgi:N utilization substance protein B
MSMSRRHQAREVALQLLFQYDLNPRVTAEMVAAYARAELNDAELEAFCLALYEGTLRHRAEIDRRIAAAAENWRLPRMAVVDRNVLRLGAYELLFAPDTPASVALDEAIELARKFGSADSPAFVNGVLDKIRQTATPSNPPASDAPA